LPRFVVLEHETPADAARGRHWDFMLAWGEVLRTWAISAPPGAADKLEAEALADHRLAYLDYEGPISGDRGAVTRWDGGTYELLSESAGKLQLRLAGERLQGVALMERAGEDPQRWIFSFSGAGSLASPTSSTG
jgi:hypothetical protein